MGISVAKSTTATVQFSTPQEIVISHTNDTIRLGDGTRLTTVTAAGALKTDSSHVTQPVSAATLPLPTGAATEATLSSVDSKLSIDLVLDYATPINTGATYTSAWFTRVHPELITTFYADQNATIKVQFSTDQSNIDSTITYTYEAGVTEPPHRLVIARKYFRIYFENTSASNMTVLRAQVATGQLGPITSALNSSVGQDADSLVVRSIESELDIASGKYVGFSIVNKFGVNTRIDSGTTPEDIWDGGGVYTGWATAAETAQVLSSNVNDTSAGTGARTVSITGLNSAYEITTETLTLNGTTPVTSVNSYIRVHTATVQSAGSGGVNAGTITVRQSTTTANIFLVMRIGYNQSHTSAYTIPAGYTGYMRKIAVMPSATANMALEGAVWTRTFGGVFRARRPFYFTNQMQFHDTIYGGLALTEKTDVILRILATTANQVPVAGSYDLVLVKN